MEYEILPDPTAGVCRVRVTGPLDVARYRAGIEAVMHALEAEPGMCTLYDLRAASIAHLTAYEMRVLGEVNQSLAPRRGVARIAVLVDSDLSFGLVRMYEALGVTPNLELRVFRDEAAAEAWARGASPDGPVDNS